MTFFQVRLDDWSKSHLRYHTHSFPQAFQTDITNVLACDVDVSLLWLVKSKQQSNNCALPTKTYLIFQDCNVEHFQVHNSIFSSLNIPRSTATNNRHLLPCRNFKWNAAEHLLSLQILKKHVLEPDGGFLRSYEQRSRHFLFLQKIKNRFYLTVWNNMFLLWNALSVKAVKQNKPTFIINNYCNVNNSLLKWFYTRTWR